MFLVITRNVSRYNEKYSRYYDFFFSRNNEKYSRYYEKLSRYNEKRILVITRIFS